jgi:hypothetical protein
VRRLSGFHAGRRLLVGAWLAVTVASVMPATAVAAKPRVINTCSLIKAAELRRIIATPVDIKRGAKITNCIFRGGQFLPIVGLTTNTGRRGFNNLIRAAGQPVTPLKGLGTQAVTYDHTSADAVTIRDRGVIVRKGDYVLQLSTNGVGMEPPGLPSIGQLVALAQVAVRRM